MDGNLTTFIRILNSIKEDGALEKEDWLLLLPLMIRLVQQLRSTIQGKPLLLIALAGVQHVLEETLEHVQEV
ncbi:MAG: hypothetical protein CL525_14325 [Aequorivita sp.]|nr:hypothetical protein [Aequorivita sp.]|tara:strand:- start:271 stop:486 length:216 start_codon:yes stop_codon:yes gene_type:complete